MNAIETRFIEPLDVLFLRGNKLFGDPGSFGEALVPPWPSAVAGALRSRMLVDAGIDPAAFARGEASHEALGTATKPGPFTVVAFHLARRFDDGRIELLIAPPADLVLSGDENEELTVKRLQPTKPAAGLACSAHFQHLAVLPETKREKPASGYWLSESGWRAYLAGELPSPSDFVKSSALWQIDLRVGVGLDTATRRAGEGKLFSVQAVAMTRRRHRFGTNPQTGKPVWADFDVGFLAAVTGGAAPAQGLVRLGGDGRAAVLHAVDYTLPEPDYAALAQARRCRLVLTTPGLFDLVPSHSTPTRQPGWLPPGCSPLGDGAWRFELGGVRARLVCAAVPRHEVISGWDLARRQPKPALRAAPAGSVFWLDELEATPEALRKLASQGLWSEPCEDAERRAEGFNRITFAAY
jgi:CRISPR-associated protein Cmr3